MFLSLANAESPLQFYVNYPNSGTVSAYGPGLVYGVANKTATFTIVTEDAGEGTYGMVYTGLPGYARVASLLEREMNMIETCCEW